MKSTGATTVSTSPSARQYHLILTLPDRSALIDKVWQFPRSGNSSLPSSHTTFLQQQHWTQISSRNSSNPNSPLNSSSQHLFGDRDRNFVAPRVTNPASSAIIPTLDFTSFTTDNQQSWSSTPLTAASAPVQHHFNQDFLLFSSPNQATNNLASQGQAIHHIAPNQTPHLLPRHSFPVSQRLPQSTIGYSPSPNNTRFLTNPNAQLQHYQRIIARQNLKKVRPPVPKFDAPNTIRHRNSAPGSTQALHDMSMFDHIDFQGGFHGDASLDFLDTSFGSAITDSPHQAHPATVSPSELFLDEAVMSAPPTTVFPNLGTPASEYLDSPDFSSGLNTTPMLDGALDSELDLTRLEAMPTLFPDAQFDQFDHFDVQPTIIANNSYGSLNELGHVVPQASPMVRQKSSPGRPPIVHDRKASLSAGINKANKKSVKDLPDIVIESEDDRETAKRKKNTAAARKSRQRKQETLSTMSAEISRLRAIIEAMGGDPDLEFS